KSLSVLGPYGRFLEIGKTDIYQNKPLGLLPFRNNLSYFAIDLERLCRDRSDLIRSLLLELMGLFNAGRLHPLPLLAFPIEHAPDAFQYMARRKNVGKIVLRVDDRQTVSTAEPCREIRRDSTYLIVGGLGGLGLATAAWMARKGARHLVLMGRT